MKALRSAVNAQLISAFVLACANFSALIIGGCVFVVSADLGY